MTSSPALSFFSPVVPCVQSVSHCYLERFCARSTPDHCPAQLPKLLECPRSAYVWENILSILLDRTHTS